MTTQNQMPMKEDNIPSVSGVVKWYNKQVVSGKVSKKKMNTLLMTIRCFKLSYRRWKPFKQKINTMSIADQAV